MRKPLIQLTYSLLLAFALTSCVTTFQTNYLQKQKNDKLTFKDSVEYVEYRLKEGDRLYIQIYSTDEKTAALLNGSIARNSALSSGVNSNSDLYTYRIKPDGNISFPNVGDIYLMGKTIRESKKAIEKAISTILSTNSVDVRILNKSFSIVGAGSSGRFTFPKEKINIFQALALAGDLGYYTDRTKIKLLRQTQTGTIIKTFNIKNVDIINSEFYYIEPDDVIFVQPMKSKFFGITTLWTAISTTITTISFGAGIYGILTKTGGN